MLECKLFHHGILGQKWGVRRGPPYPIEDKVLKKGTKINSVSFYNNSDKYKKNGRWMYTYNPKDKWDSSVYKGPFSVYKMQEGKSYVYEHKYIVTDDLKMPTRKERIDEFINVYNKDKLTAISELEMVQRQMKLHDVGSKETQNLDLHNMKTDDDYDKAYELFNHAMERCDIFKTTKAYADTMSKKYDAMVDDNNQGAYNEVNDPVIIFRAEKALKKIGNARLLSVAEIENNYRKVERELSKKGKPVML